MVGQPRGVPSILSGVILQHSLQLQYVFRVKQTSEHGRWKCAEGFVGGCEDGKWAGAGKGPGEIARLEGLDERREIRHGLRELHDIRRGRRRWRWGWAGPAADLVTLCLREPSAVDHTLTALASIVR